MKYEYIPIKKYKGYFLVYDTEQIPDGVTLKIVKNLYDSHNIIVVDSKKSNYDFNWENIKYKYEFVLVDINTRSGFSLYSKIIYNRKYFFKQVKNVIKKLFSKDGYSFKNKLISIKHILAPTGYNFSEYIIEINRRMNIYLMDRDIITFKNKKDILCENLFNSINDKDTKISANVVSQKQMINDINIGAELDICDYNKSIGQIYSRNGYWIKVLEKRITENGNYLVKIISKDNSLS